MNLNAGIAALLLVLVATGPVHGFTRILTLAFPGELPEGLRITVGDASPEDPDLLTVRSVFEPTAPPSYRGRIRASARLTVSHPETGAILLGSPVAVNEREGGTVTATFRLARSAFEKTTLEWSTSLHEVDGLATVGGGVIYRIQLAGFRPD